MKGRVHSIETMAGLDGPGMRCVVFLQGCPMRCRYCHNPDTWNPQAGAEVDAAELVERVLRYRPYFSRRDSAGATGGVTLGGGEPLLQAHFAAEVLAGCRAAGVHTAIDTCGCRLDQSVRDLLGHCDLVLLDIKHADPARYRELTGGELEPTLRFLEHVSRSGIAAWVRQVIIPGWNDSDEQVRRLAELVRPAASVRKVQLLPYHTMARGKWAAAGMEYPLEGTPPPAPELMRRLRRILREELGQRADAGEQG